VISHKNPRYQFAFVFSILFSEMAVFAKAQIALWSVCACVGENKGKELKGKGTRGDGTPCIKDFMWHLSAMFRCQWTVRCYVRTVRNQATKLVSWTDLVTWHWSLTSSTCCWSLPSTTALESCCTTLNYDLWGCSSTLATLQTATPASSDRDGSVSWDRLDCCWSASPAAAELKSTAC